jgi:glycosyltransferase involved in cell wall biosynthesis
MRSPIAIACSGLGHVRRGNETWARDIAAALHAAGAPVTLFGGGPLSEADSPYIRIPHLRRDFPVLRRWLPWSKRYLAEQLSFLLGLRRRLLRGSWRLVHLCDPDLALQMHRRTRGTGLQVVFKDGMRLGPHWCSRLDFVQVLAPHYRDVVAREAGVDTRGWFVIPHLVDIRTFQPPPDRRQARAAWPELELAPGAFVVVGVGDYSAGGNKRLEWLVQEVAALPAAAEAVLVLAGQSEPEVFRRFEATAREALGRRVRLLRNLPRAQVVKLYQVADVFTHAALQEPFGIVFLEAMASGLPLAGHTWPVTQWVIGDAGESLDMTRPGALAGTLTRWHAVPAEREALAARARKRATEQFAPDCLVPRYLEMYEAMESSTHAPGGSR